MFESLQSCRQGPSLNTDMETNKRTSGNGAITSWLFSVAVGPARLHSALAMSTRPLLNRQLPQKYERPSYFLGAAVGWVLFGLLFRFCNGEFLAFSAVLSGPCLLLLTYFTFGGDIPLRWRQKGYHRIMLVGVVWWASFIAAFTVAHLWPSISK
jgi:hypothetical protein